jgi:hypothetical protein
MTNFISIFFDGMGVFFGLFILAVVLLNYFIPYPYTIIISLSISIIFTMFSVKRMNFTRSKKGKELLEKKKTAKAVTALNLMKKQDLDTLLIKALDLLDAKAVNGGYYCKSQNKGFLFKFGFEKVTKADVVRAFNLGGEKAEIYAESFDKEVVEFAGRFNGKIELFDGVKTVNLLSSKGVLPSENYSSFYTEKKKPVFKKELLYKKNAKKFLIFGVTFCFFSFFAPIKAYYLICGGLMISYSIFLMLYGKEKD